MQRKGFFATITCLLLALALCAAPVAPVRACPPDEDVTAAYLSVENILQNPQLPNGCEITSLAIVLQYYGYDITKTELADDYLPKQARADGYGPDPYDAYINNPRSSAGWYCWAPPIVEAANRYLEEQDSIYTAVDITGAEAQELEGYINDGAPVVIWVTIDWRRPRQSGTHSWLLEDGTRYVPYTNVHCMVLTGYDEETIRVANPLSSTTKVNRETFFETYEALGSHAVVLRAE